MSLLENYKIFPKPTIIFNFIIFFNQDLSFKFVHKHVAIGYLSLLRIVLKQFSSFFQQLWKVYVDLFILLWYNILLGPPQVKLPKIIQIKAFEKETVILNCHVRSHSSAHIIWLIKNAVHKRKLVPGESFDSSRYSIHNCGQELHIQYAGISDSGKYTCTVENERGSVEHISILEVRGKMFFG